MRLSELVECHPGIGFWKSYHRLRLHGHHINHKRLYHIYTSMGLNILDDFNRQVLWIESDSSLPADRVIRVLENLKESRGLPRLIRVDNSPELISTKLDIWCRDHDVTLAFIQAGKPSKNAFIERFNQTVRTEVLNDYVF